MYQFVADRSMSEAESISLEIIEKVAERDGTEPATLQPPLHAVVDTDALDALFRSTSGTSRAAGTVEFRYRGYTIRVDASGAVEIGEPVPVTEQSKT